VARNSRDAHGAVAESKVLYVDPTSLVLVTDKTSVLYDERVELPIDDKMVRSIMHAGVIEPVIVKKNPETGRLEVVAGRQRTKNNVEANKRLKKEGREPIPIPIIVKRVSEESSADVMIIENEIRSADTPLGRAAKMRRMLERGRTDADVAVVFGVTTQTVRNTVSILDASAAVRKAVENGTIGAADGYKLAKLEPAEQKEKLEALAKHAPKTPGKRRQGGARKAREIVTGVTATRTRAEVVTLRAEIANQEAVIKENDRRVALATLNWVLGEDSIGEFFDVPADEPEEAEAG
jgi:ParB family transcriptional regulator, chromosome partitioning protein